MSQLSEMLAAIQEKRGISMAELAKRSSIGRTTLYQYMSGKRPIANQAHLEAITAALCLTPRERQQVGEAFIILQMGPALYRQRKTVDQFLRTLPMQDSTVRTGLEGPGSLETQGGVLYGEQAVAQAAYALIARAYQSGSSLELMIQPDQGRLLAGLSLLSQAPVQAHVTHIFCLEADARQGRIDNLTTAQNVLKFSALVRDYKPLYYYGNAREHFGPVSLLPGLVATPAGALEISAQGNLALLHTQPDVVSALRQRFSQVARQCSPLLLYKPSLEAEIRWGLDRFTDDYFEHTLEIAAGLCSAAFWTEDLLRRYINPDIPNFEAVVRQFCTYVRQAGAARRRGHTVQLLNPAYVRAFLQTGVFQEYPASFLAGALAPEDRRYLARQVLNGAREGWLELRFLPERLTLLNPRTEVCVHNGREVIIQYWYDDRFLMFSFLEPGIADALEDYLGFLRDFPETLSNEDSQKLLQSMIEEYL